MKTVTIHNRSTASVVGDRIEVADESLTRLIGLLGRRNLPSGSGLWISPSSGIHTMGMHFPIDVVGLDAHLRVVKLWPRVKPFRVSSVSLKTRSVIELAAGEIDARSIQLGHWLEVIAPLGTVPYRDSFRSHFLAATHHAALSPQARTAADR